MPYASVDEVPSYVPKEKRKQWLEVWNSSYKEHGDEERAFREANAVAGPNASKVEESDSRIPSGSAGYMELKGATKDGDCHKVAVAGGISSLLGCCNEFHPEDEDVKQFRCGTCEFVKIDATKVQEDVMDPVAKSKSFDEPEIFCRLVKVDEAKREVWGVVTSEEPDRDGEICDFDTTVPFYQAIVDEMKKASEANPAGGTNIFPLRAMHGLIAAGKGIAIEFRKEAKEIYMGFKVVDDQEWKKVAENVYTGFSQGGRYVKRWKDGDYTRYTAKPGEVSLVDIPCLEAAHFDTVKALKAGGYDYIKTDGTTEFRKFHKEAPISAPQGDIPTTPTTVTPVNPSAVACTCECASCKAGSCQMCMAGEKCACFGEPSKTAKTPKKRSKTVDMAKNLKKLAAYKEIVKTSIEDRINLRAFGYLGKGMYTIGCFADIIDSLGWLLMSIEYEEEMEGDEEEAAPSIEAVRSHLDGLLDAFLTYTEEQVEEAKEFLSVK